MFDTNNARQGYGAITFDMVNLISFDFTKSFVLSKLLDPKVTESPEAQKVYFRVSFYDFALDRLTAPVTYSD